MEMNRTACGEGTLMGFSIHPSMNHHKCQHLGSAWGQSRFVGPGCEGKETVSMLPSSQFSKWRWTAIKYRKNCRGRGQSGLGLDAELRRFLFH
jgi:hypothetical protein